jgi:hypothetical protein
MIRPTSHNLLAIYSGVLTAILAVVLLSGFAAPEKNARFEEITVQRINVVEPDGTLRLIITDKARSPGIFMKGKEYLRGQRQSAGVLFLNDEGSENGGLTFGGLKDPSGRVSSYGHLSFDQYMQDQVLTLDANQSDDDRRASVAMIDRPDYPITELLELLERIQNWPPEQQKAELDRFNATHPQPQRRIALARNGDRSVGLQLKDPQGRDRIVLKVEPNGQPKLQFLDDKGRVISELPK